MIHLIADDTALEILTRVHEEVVLYDSTGTRVIGHFSPVDLERGKRIYAELHSRIDQEEIERRIAELGPHRPVSELIEELKALYPIDAPPEGFLNDPCDG